MPASRKGLSFVPRVRIAQSFSEPGVASMTRDPTAVMGVGAPSSKAASTAETPTPAAADSSPAAAPRATRVAVLDGLTQRIRRPEGSGLG